MASTKAREQEVKLNTEKFYRKSRNPETTLENSSKIGKSLKRQEKEKNITYQYQGQE